MLTFFQHFFIGKMEEENQNEEEVVDQEQPESEHSDETTDPEATEPVEEATTEESSDDEESHPETDTIHTEEIEVDSTDDTDEHHYEDLPEHSEIDVNDIQIEIEDTPDAEDPSELQEESEDNDTVQIEFEPLVNIYIEDPLDNKEESEIEVSEIDESQDTDESDDVISESEEHLESDEPSETEETDEEEDSDPVIEEIPPETLPQVPYSLGESELLYDFVEMFEVSSTSGGEQISANMADTSGGVTKPSLFEHPSPHDTSRITYNLTLPSVSENGSLILHFSIGLRDGVVFDDLEKIPGGVNYSIEISGEQLFESQSNECSWNENTLDITHLADSQVELTFITRCQVEGNSSYAWALWGQPKLLKLTRNNVGEHEEKTGKQKAQPSEIQCGLAITNLPEDTTAIFEFNRDDFTPTYEIAADIYNQFDTDPTDLTLYVAQPKLEIVSIGSTAAVVATGEAFEVQCTIKNTGIGPLGKNSKTRLTINDIKLRRGRNAHNLKPLAVGDTATYVWYARGVSRPTNQNFSISLKSRTHQVDERIRGVIQIRPAQPKLEAQVVPELHTYMENKHIVFGNKHLRLILVHSDDQSRSKNGKGKNNKSNEPPQVGYEYIAIYVTRGSTYQQIATTKMIAEVTYLSEGNSKEFRFIPNDVQLVGNSLGESIIRISGEHADTDGVKWTLQLQLILTDDVKRIKAKYSLSTDREREILAFRTAEIYAGHKSTREKKTAAIFPGLEFLEDDEPSSNTRDAAPPLNNRLVPHPYKITIPVMAIEIQKSVVGIAWDPMHCWDGEAQSLSATFASPNWYHQERNHLMGLFIPTIPDWVKENTLIAEKPYSIKPDHPINIDCEIIADGNASILDAISHWTSAYGSPEPLEPPRNDEEELLLSRHGFMHSVWDEEARQSRHCVDWSSQNEPGFANLLWYDYLITKSDEVLERVKEIGEKTIADAGPKGLAARGSCHILNGDFPFYYGHIDAAMEHYESEIHPILDSQSEDGSWGFQPTTEQTKGLGTDGDVVLGTCASNALKLLKHARITGNKSSLEAGKKALSYMDRFVVPRGAQAWECPLYEPDILAAAHAIGAYVEAHEVLGNKSYLKRAEYWAQVGLLFLYHWHLPDRPGMRYASIPVFGTTFFTHSWLGVPVQWNGLVYAYYLQRLNQHAKDEKWQKIAEGITVSAMYQQWTDGELKGTYPDGFYGYCTEGKGPHLNPEDIMVNVYTLRGLDPCVKTVISGSIHLSSGATPTVANTSRNGEFKWTLNYADNEVSYTLITGHGQPPSNIRTQVAESDDDRDDSAFDIPEVDSLEEVSSGWRYLPERDAILIKQKHLTAEMQFLLVK
ncbi:hypothetical protein C6497_02880 [Candidatus Poribacteria bacterium]|nr:MAG: hypothetical protein C6497_02880 [Candidatus Poribacteria bacterium]